MNFGEIFEPATRTAWEDWDDDLLSNESKLVWQSPLEVPKNIKLLIILDGKFTSDCIRLQKQESVELINSIKNINLCLYKVKYSDSYICVLKDYDLLYSSEIVELLREILIASRDVVSVLNKPIMEYQTTHTRNHSCVIRSLCTSIKSSNLKGLHFTRLEQPNIISGVTAGVLSLREHLNLPATAVLYYLEFLESHQMKAIHNLLENFSVSYETNIGSNNIVNSNLYI
ncbi:unnamed protein product [Leptidea sinapis]|uniref:Proteasome assembly chaperone 1 n=1 Tax=Leptidea sinapis TaxID=189913 RepID=A0A5E4QGC1_9NEOP|nr:unnamed protein product [Leptidea sinapis]